MVRVDCCLELLPYPEKEVLKNSIALLETFLLCFFFFFSHLCNYSNKCTHSYEHLISEMERTGWVSSASPTDVLIGFTNSVCSTARVWRELGNPSWLLSLLMFGLTQWIHQSISRNAANKMNAKGQMNRTYSGRSFSYTSFVILLVLL